MKKLFLKWVLFNVVAAVVIVLTLLCFGAPVVYLPVFGKCVLGVMAAIYVVTSLYAGVLCWRTDVLFELPLSTFDPLSLIDIKKRLHQLLCKADNISFQANECPFIGLFGAVAGFIFAMLGNNGLAAVNSATDIKGVIANCMAGIGIAFLTTLTGVFFRIVLMQIYHLVDHSVESALIELGDE